VRSWTNFVLLMITRSHTIFKWISLDYLLVLDLLNDGVLQDWILANPWEGIVKIVKRIVNN
jgi:hypothetical protein